MTSATQLLLYGFEPGAAFQGRLVGAIERIEIGETLRVLDVLFVMRDADTGGLRPLGDTLEPGGAMAALLVEHA
jgi:hypothetical protein